MAWVKNLRLDFKGFSLRIPNWEFPEHGISAVWGESGSGKTTLLEFLAGFHPAPGALFSLKGELLSELPIAVRNIGMVYQDYALFPHLSAEQNIVFGPQARGLPKEAYSPTFHALVNRLALGPHLKKFPAQLSGGERQRVALARALVTRPSLVLLDEPFSALDEKLRGESRCLLNELCAEFEVPFLLVTHDLRDVRAIAEHLLILSHGQMLAAGAAREMLAVPPNLETARVIPENQLLRYTSVFQSALDSQSCIHREDSEAVEPTLVVKPWSFEIGGGLDARIQRCVDEGHSRRCWVKFADGQNAWVIFSDESSLGQDRVQLKLRGRDCVLFQRKSSGAG